MIRKSNRSIRYRWGENYNLFRVNMRGEGMIYEGGGEGEMKQKI